MRVLKCNSEKLLFGWSRQPVPSFLSIPPLVYEVFTESEDFEERKELLLQRIQQEIRQQWMNFSQTKRHETARSGQRLGRLVIFVVHSVNRWTSHTPVHDSKATHPFGHRRAYSKNEYALVWSSNSVPWEAPFGVFRGQ